MKTNNLLGLMKPFSDLRLHLLVIVMLCFWSITPLHASGGNANVTFNPSVRYSQWAINSRLYDFRGNQKQFGFDNYDASNKLIATTQWKNGSKSIDKQNDYVAGLVGKAVLEAADYYGSYTWSAPWFYSAQAYATGCPYKPNGSSNLSKITLDNMNAAKMAFPILRSSLATSETKTTLWTAIDNVLSDLKLYNTNYSIGGTKLGITAANANDVQQTMLGGWMHKPSYLDQMWCDGAYMGPALFADLVHYKNATTLLDSNNDWDLIGKQLTIVWNQCHDATTGLLYHAFTANPGDDASKSWAGISKDEGIYHSAAFWGRANAWYMLALVDVLEYMPTDNSYYATLKQNLESLAASLKKVQANDGCWYQVLDYQNPLSGNYEEASCTTLFAAAYLKAIRLGLLDKATYEATAKKAYEGAVALFVVYDNNDPQKVQIVKSCTSAGLGGSDSRNGSRDYYITGKDAKVVTSADPTSSYYYTEGKALGGFVMAATEYERAYQYQENHQILFAYDLAPAYDFTSTGGELAVEALGSGTPAYQWYKDGTAIADATLSTYTPTASGTYYCTAKANGSTIQTSPTKVTVKENTGGNTTPSGTIFAYNVPTSGNVTTDPYPATGGTVTYQAGADFTEHGYKFVGKANYIKVDLADNTLQPGDRILLQSYSTTTGVGLLLSPDGNTSNAIPTPKLSDKKVTEELTYTVTADDVLNGKASFYIFRNGGTIYVSKITIIRGDAGSTKTPLTASIDDMYGVVDDHPYEIVPTVMAGDEVLAMGDEYTVSYEVANENVATVTNGKVNFKAPGTTIITANITPVNTTLYTPCTTTFQVTVSSASEDNTYRVEKNDENGHAIMYHKHMVLSTPMKTLQVTLGGWMFKNNKNVNSALTKEKLGEGDWGPAQKDKWGQGEFSYYTDESNNKNARQEDGGNPQLETTNTYNAKMEKQNVTIRDNMFNVPASGSYLAIAPTTAGTVKVHIFQNGVFDQTKQNIHYRPQRRVFVMDEQGNFVSSSAECRNADKNPPTFDLSKYSWDLKDINMMDTALIESHFVGLHSLNFVKGKFKNGVYESNLPTDIVPNAVLANSSQSSLPGAHGWCVLADAPVTYTFNVRPGKTYYIFNYGSKIGLYGFSFDPAETTTDDISYESNTTNTIVATPKGHVAKVQLDRVFHGGVWNAAVLPFSLNKQQVDALFGQTYGNGSYDADNTQIIYFDRVEGNTIYFMRHAYNTIVAGKPFLIKPKRTGDFTLNTADCEAFPYVTVENTTPANWCDTDDYAWMSSYSNDQTVKNGDYYIGSIHGDVIRRVDGDVTISGFKGFLKALSPSAQSKELCVGMASSDTPGETTVIPGLLIDANGNLVERPLSGHVYSLDGRMVARDASSFDSLPKGIYIVNGKKFVK